MEKFVICEDNEEEKENYNTKGDVTLELIKFNDTLTNMIYNSAKELGIGKARMDSATGYCNVATITKDGL